MLRRASLAILFVLAALNGSTRALAAGPIQYRFSFPEPQHHWMQVQATFPDLDPAQPLDLRMSQSSPGRYSLHEFAKNLYDVHAVDEAGRELAVTRPDPSGWTVPSHGATVTVRYRIFGDMLDGTYLAIDTTHAHINMPAAVMWARGLDDRPSTLTFEEPAGMNWRVATQLHAAARPAAAVAPHDGSASSGPLVFSAPNLQYLMDSPAEFGPVSMREFTVGGRRFRFALHHEGTEADLDAYMKDVEKIVAQEGAVYGEYPVYEPGYYTFLADYLPYAHGDGMEHRNSTVMTGVASIHSRPDAERMLGTVAHEFFHCWNVERIRPQGIEPFDFDRANMTDSLWLAEGFTQYYGELILRRAGITGDEETYQTLARVAEWATLLPGRQVRSAVDMSRMAPFIDGGRPNDRTNWRDTVISYYSIGDAIALALDLSLRERGGKTLDDFMRAMWQAYGRPGGVREGYVDHPYGVADAEARLAEVSGDAAFAHDFFARYVEGRDALPFARLFAGAGLVLRPRAAGEAWIGDLDLDTRGGVRIRDEVASNSPAYAAGLDEDDLIVEFGGEPVASPADLGAGLRRHKPGDRVDLVYRDRRGSSLKTVVTLGGNPHLELVPAESAGLTVSAAQRSLRDAWLGPRPALPTTPPARR